MLPLLQFALTGIWEGLKQGKSPAESLNKMGGVGGALAQRAGALYEALPATEQAIARRVFLRLIRLGESARDTRRRTTVESLSAYDEAPDTLREVLAKLSQADARLVTLSEEQGRTLVEITHEALLDHWEPLRNWLSESREDLRFAERLDEAVRHWRAHRRAKGLLWWQPPDFDLLDAFRTRQHLSTAQMEFYRASRSRRRAQRRFKFGLVVLLVILTASSSVAMFWALRAEQDALQAKERALHQKELALEAIDVMTYGLADKLAPLPRSGPIVTEILQRNVKLLDRIYALDPDARKAMREKASNLSRSGNQWLESGNTQAALADYRKSFELFEKLAHENPDNAAAQRDLSTSHEKIGNVQLRLGDSKAARAAYERSLKIREKLVREDPDSAEAQRDLSVSHGKIGDVQLRLGDSQAALNEPDRALDYFERGLNIARSLARDTANKQAQTDLTRFEDQVLRYQTKQSEH